MACRRPRRKEDNTRLIVGLFAFIVGLRALIAVGDAATAGDLGRAALIVLALVGILLVGLVVWQPKRAWAAIRWTWRRLRGRKKAAPVRPGAPIAASREPIPAGLRFAVLKRDGFRCSYCGRGETEGVKLHIDHLVPVARGGRNELDNLVTACQDCNLGKAASDIVGPTRPTATPI